MRHCSVEIHTSWLRTLEVISGYLCVVGGSALIPFCTLPICRNMLETEGFLRNRTWALTWLYIKAETLDV